MLAVGAGFHRGSLGAVGGLSSLGFWQRHPRVKTGVDHHDLLNFGCLLTPIQHYSCLESRIWMIGAGDCLLFLGMSDGVGAGGSCLMR